MRKFLSIIVAVVAITVLSSCGGGNTPEAVAEDFYKALQKADFDKAKTYCTDDTKQMIHFVEGMISEEVKAKMKDSKPEVKAEKAEISEDGTEADVKVTILNSIDAQTGKLAEKDTQDVSLKKVDDKWLIDISK